MTTSKTQTILQTTLTAIALTLCGACDVASDELVLDAALELRPGLGGYAVNNYAHLVMHVTTDSQQVGTPQLLSVMVPKLVGMAELDSVWVEEDRLHGVAGGVEYSGEDFLGSIWTVQIMGMLVPQERIITDVELRNPLYISNPGVDLYEFTDGDGDGNPLSGKMCGEHSMAVVLDDLYLHADGSLVIRDDTLLFGCENGGLAKAVKWGYRPWGPAGRLGVQAATRMAIADYCGDGTSYTDQGVGLWMDDKWGLNNGPGLNNSQIDAVWNANGANCLSSPRSPSVKRSDVSCSIALPKCSQNPPLFGGNWLASWGE